MAGSSDIAGFVARQAGSRQRVFVVVSALCLGFSGPFFWLRTAGAQPAGPAPESPDGNRPSSPADEPGADGQEQPASPPLSGPEKSLDSDPAGAAATPLPPWHVGVAEADKKRAQALFEEGNALYDNILLIEAAERYRRALEFWDHPAIQLNLAKTLLLLQRQVEVYQTLKRATRYGPGSHDSPAAYKWATDTLQRLESQLVVLDIRCSQPGVDISLDGKKLFFSPGVAVRHLLPGQHTLVAKKPGYLTESETLILEPGTRKTVLFALLPIARMAVQRRRWAVFMPWAVVGSAAALTTAGALLRWRAGIDYEAFDRAFSSECRDGCDDGAITPGTAALEARARWENGFGLGALLVGGAGLIAGAALVVLNQPRTFQVSAESGIHIAVTPAPTSSGAIGWTAHARWQF